MIKSRKPCQIRSRLSSDNFVSNSNTKYGGGGIGEILNLWQNSLDMKDPSRSGDPLAANLVHLKLDLVAKSKCFMTKFNSLPSSASSPERRRRNIREILEFLANFFPYERFLTIWRRFGNDFSSF